MTIDDVLKEIDRRIEEEQQPNPSMPAGSAGWNMAEGALEALERLREWIAQQNL